MSATFKQLEQSGWTEKAGAYDAHFGVITGQANAHVLDAAGELDGRAVLDVCCGPGELTLMAAARGAHATGVDFAPSMIELARVKQSAVAFQVGDAEALDFPDHQFDAVLCSFGLWHLAEPDKAIAEAARVLRPGGVYVYTTWLPPEAGWDMFDLLTNAIAEYGSAEVNLPPAPPPFRFADEAEATAVLEAAALNPVCFERRMAIWTGDSGQALLDMIYKAIVRTPMMIDAQPPDAREAIHDALRSGAEAMRKNGRISMRWPYLIGSGRLRA